MTTTFTLTRHNVRKLFFLVPILSFLCAFSFAQNPVVTENLLPGTPQADWYANEGGPIEGFAQEFSVNKGETVHFKINIASPTLVPYSVKIYRVGYYQGNGARFITDLGPLMGKEQPAYNYETASGKVDCSNWSVSAQWAVPNDASTVSGVYVARFDCSAVGGSSIQVFVVRDDAANSPLLFKTSDATWQAYNSYGGNTFYTAATPVPGFNHATKISYQRPVYNRGDKSGFLNSEYPMIRWLEQNGYNVSYTTDMDMARNPSVITPANHKAVLSVGHDEYWSAEQRTKFENARANGVHVAFFSGNEIYWKTRWEDNYQTLVCYKEGTMGELVCGYKCDPLPNVWTGLWRDGCSSSYGSNDGCKPEGSFSGQMSWTQSLGSLKVPDTYKNLRLWKNTSIANLGTGQTATLPYGTLGQEWDPEQFTQTYPAHRVVLSNTVQTGLTHKMSLYKYSSGALIFSAGTMNFAWGLDGTHDNGTSDVSADMQQFTVNLFHDMGVEAGSIQANLVVPTIAYDVLAPSTTITSPLHNAAVSGESVTITGTSIDNGTGAVAGVEVSIDNGLTWNVATGLENWSYTFSPTGYATIAIKVRAWDDLGNVEIPGTPGSPNCISISLAGPFKYSVFNATYPAVPPTFYSGNPVELGMKFRSSITGNITGFRYYKAAGVTGTHIGHLWSSTGTLLAEATFTNETASGWQTVLLNTPVAVEVNTTYVVSYFSASGDFTKQDPFFTQPVINGFLRGLANGEDGGNGVYAYSATPSFPDNTFGSSNYFADVIFESNDITAPQVSLVSPLDGSTGLSLNIHPTATFSETLDAASVTRSSVTMTGPGNTPVSGSVTLTDGTTITFTPQHELVVNSTYTVTLKGAGSASAIKDLIGNPMASNYSWSFTTGILAMPIVMTKPVSISTCSNTSVNFVSSASGIPTPTVQWQKSTDNGFTWADITGATSGTYTFTAFSTDNNNQYRAVWTNSQGHDISAPATLNVEAAVSGSIVPVNATVCPGAPLLLQLNAASGPSPYTLQINSSIYTGISVGQTFQALLPKESIWSELDIPQEPAHADNNSIEVGVKFQANKNGLIKGIRFYKGSSANGGTHIGSLWSQSGTLLASATFENETETGWQEVLFATPVDVTANTTYVASYFLPQGNYAKTGSYFSISRSNGKSLTALQNTAGEPNAVYAYDSHSTFPDRNFGDPNYWVDVVFAPYVTTSTTFNLTSITVSNGCSQTGNPISSATITVGTVVNAGTVTGSSPLCIGASATFSSDGSTGGVWSSSNPSVATVDAAGLVTATGAGSCDIIYSVTGCNGVFTASQPLVVNPDANAGVLSGASSLCIGSTDSYVSNGDAGGVWSSSNSSIASVDAAGLVTALSAGTTDIKYTVSSGCNNPASSIKTLTVNANIDAGIVSGMSSLCAGATNTYSSNGDAGGQWSTSNPAVASVNSAGLVTALSAGTTDITYTVTEGCNGPVSSFKTLTVNPDANAGTVIGTSLLCIGTSTNTYSSNGDAGGIWSSSNPVVASVNPSTGLVTALSAGSSDITYTVSAGCNGPVSSFKTLTVTPNVNAGTVSGAAQLCIGITTAYTSNGNANGSWSSSNPGVASVNASTGMVTALTAGTTNIVYTISTGCGGPVSSFKSLTVSPNVNAGTVNGISPLCTGATASYTSNGTLGGTWSSSNPAVATVNSSGVVTVLTAGTTNIIYTVNSVCGGPFSSFKTLTVNPNANAGTVSGASPLCLNATTTYTSNGNTGGTWSSSNPAIATVTPAGLVKGLTSGTVNIIYTVTTGCNAPVSSFKTLTVGSNINAGTVNGTTPLCIGRTAAYTSTGNAGGVWSSSNPAVATVNATTGAVTTLSAGSTIIKYTVTNSCSGQAFSSKTLTVSLNANAGTVSGITPYCSLQVSQFTSNGDPGGTWSSSNPLVTYVTPSGIAIALFFGTADVIYTVNTGCNAPVSASKSVTISLFPYTGVISGNSPLCAGTTTVYTTNGSTGGTWTSSNTAIATVNAVTGAVTAVRAGTAVITYTVKACFGNASTSKTITVNPVTVINAGNITGSAALCLNVTNTFSSNGTQGGVWRSSNPAVASVNASTGVVKALAVGTTTITYTVTPVCGNAVTASKTLLVNSCNTFANTGNTNTTTGRNTVSTGEGDKVINPANDVKILRIEAYPNPSSSEFTIALKGNSSDRVLITVTDILGKKVYQAEGINNQQYKFGQNFMAGMYLVQVKQGNNVQTIKLIKE